MVGIRAASGNALFDLEPTGFIELNATIKSGIKAFAEVSMARDAMVGSAGIKIDW